MKNIKTCDEYVLHELEICQQENALLNKEIEEMKAKEISTNEVIEEIKELKDNEVILKNETQYIYYLDVSGSYKFNSILRKNDLLPTLFDDFSDETVVLFADYERKGDFDWRNEKVLNVQTVEVGYEFKIAGMSFYLTTSLNGDNPSLTTYVIDNKRYFNTPEEARECGLKELRKEIESYIKNNEKDKFKPKEEQ